MAHKQHHQHSVPKMKRGRSSEVVDEFERVYARLLSGIEQAGLSFNDGYSLRAMISTEGELEPYFFALCLCEMAACHMGSVTIKLEAVELALCLSWFGIGGDEAADWIPGMLACLDRERRMVASIEIGEYPQRVAPFVMVAKRFFYRHRHCVSEQFIADWLALTIRRPWQHFPLLEQVLQRITDHRPLQRRLHDDQGRVRELPVQLAPNQIVAVLVAACAPFCVISGGPGTGKTSVIATLLRLLCGLGVEAHEIALAAPTGRAAMRMGEAIRESLASLAEPMLAAWLDSLPQPQTVHRLLASIQPFGEERVIDREVDFFQQSPCPWRWLIVDESSMLDLALTDRLLSRLGSDIRLVCIGDSDQLPSVGAGAVFRDLSVAGEGMEVEQPLLELERRLKAPLGLNRHQVCLTKTFRQGSDDAGLHIRTMANKANRMRADDLFGLDDGENVRLWDGKGLLPQAGVHFYDGAIHQLGSLLRLCVETYWADVAIMTKKEIDPEVDEALLLNLFRQFERLRILCLTQRGPGGVQMCNRLVNQALGVRNERDWFPGSAWMITRNDYRLNLFNGDVGIGIWLRTGGTRRRGVVFRQGERFRTFALNRLSVLEPAFAMTVHKSQGSEAAHILLVLPERENALCTKELIYTAITRAKRSVLIVGHPVVLRAAVSHRVIRTSRLTEQVARALRDRVM